MNWLRACGFVLATLVAVQAQAHVFFDRAEPRVGSTVSVAPAQVKLWFSEAIEPASSTVMVMDSKGQRVDKGDAQVDPAAPELMHVSLGALGPGEYMVVWRAKSPDGHFTNGDFLFRVGP